MRIEHNNIVIRSAIVEDATLLNKWWNDGEVMDHAGFPNGLGQPMEETIDTIKSYEGKLSQLCIIEFEGTPVGELSFGISPDNNASYPGWKICESSYQNKGIGPKVIDMVFNFIFTDENINSKYPMDKIIWDTMIENTRAQYIYENKIKARKTKVEENAWTDQLGNPRTAVHYEITKEEFYKNR